jgi:hypothetical protein
VLPEVAELALVQSHEVQLPALVKDEVEYPAGRAPRADAFDSLEVPVEVLPFDELHEQKVLRRFIRASPDTFESWAFGRELILYLEHDLNAKKPYLPRRNRNRRKELGDLAKHRDEMDENLQTLLDELTAAAEASVRLKLPVAFS